MATIEIRDFAVEPGTKKVGTVKVGEWNDGSPIGLPVGVLNGRSDGPVMLALACIHGDEVVGADVLRRLFDEVDPESFSGAIIAVFAANIPAFITGTRVNILEDPAGWNDLGELLMTAQANGSLSDRLAYFIRDELGPKCDYYVDLHSSARGSNNYPRAIVAGEYVDLEPEVRRVVTLLREACNLEYVFQAGKSTWEGMYFELEFPFEERYSKPGLVLETGYAPTFEGSDILFDSMVNILAAMGNMKGSGERTTPLTILERLVAVRANRGGLWMPTVHPPETVKKGAELGRIVDFSGAVSETIVAPEDGIVVKIATTSTISTGVRTHVLGIPAA